MIALKKLLPLALVILYAAACSDDVATGNCDATEHFDPVTEACVPIQCPSGSSFNPIENECQTDDGTVVDPVDPSGNNSTENNGTENNTTENNGTENNTTENNSPENNTTENNTTENNSSGNNNTSPNEDGDGAPPYDPFQPQDASSAEYHSCDSDEFDGLAEPRFIHNNVANYLLAADASVSVANFDFSSVPVQGHLLEDGDTNYSGFIIAMSPPGNESSASGSANWLFNQIDSIANYNATRQGDGHPYLTHDSFSAHVLNHVHIDTDDSPSEVRDQVVGSFFGIAAADMEYDLDDTTSSDGSGAHLVYKTVVRTEEDIIIVGAVTTSDLYESTDSEARFAVQDLAGGTALAAAGETMSDECVSLEIRDTTEVDIIVSLDASGSMTDVQNGLVDFADELVAILNEADVDWRVAVTGVDCDEIREDEALSPEFRALWPDPDEWEEEEPPFPIPGGDMLDDIATPCRTPSMLPTEDNNGRLMGDFTTDPAEIQSQMQNVSTTGLEYTLTMGIAALDHSLPRSDNAGDKLRTNAAPVVIAVTDENEQLFKDAFSWIAGDSYPISASQQAELNEFIQPWLNYINRPDLGATISGLYWVPGTNCNGGEDVAHGIHHIVEQTGGVYDSICSPDIGQSFGDIADATQNIETGLHLVGSPVSHTIEVDVADIGGGSVTPLARSIADGFDFDTTTNSLYFEGPSAPEVDERVVVPYLQWDGTVRPCTDLNPCPGDQMCIKGTCQ